MKGIKVFQCFYKKNERDMNIFLNRNINFTTQRIIWYENKIHNANITERIQIKNNNTLYWNRRCVVNKKHNFVKPIAFISRMEGN